MISESLLNKAVERGILSTVQLADLRTLVAAESPQLAEAEDDEKLRFVSGFSDIFVTLGIGLFVGAISYFGDAAYGVPGRWAALVAVTWPLAEFFTRRRRMPLPSVVLLCLFAVGVFGASVHLLNYLSGGPALRSWDPFGFADPRPAIITGAALVTVAMTALHYWRFRVPMTVAAAAGSLAGAALGLLFTVAPDFAEDYVKFFVFAAGLGIFVLAMRFDLSDPSRITRRTDIAFWLHLLSAPLIVHPLIATPGLDGGKTTTSVAVAILAIFIALGAVAVVIDRRAMLVSALAYAGVAFVTLIQRAGITDQSVPATLLALGAFVLLLSAGWRPLRAKLLGLLPPSLAGKLPHPILSA